MRILILMNMYPPYSDGGYPLLCQEAVDELKLRGHEILVLTSHYQCSEKINFNSDIWRAFDYCPKNEKNELQSSSLLDLYAWYRKEWQEQKIVNRALDDFNPEAIFIWATKGMSYSIAIRLAQTGIPLFAYVCGYWLVDHNNLGAMRRQYQFWSWGNKNSISGRLKAFTKKWLGRYIPLDFMPLLFDALAYNSEAVLQDLKSPASKSKPRQLYDSAPLDRFRQMPVQRLNGRHKILFIGRLHPSKDPLTLIKACKQLQNKNNTAKITLSLVGWPHDPEYLALLNSEIASATDPASFAIIDPVSFAEIPDLFAAHDVLVVPSAVDPLPRVAAEGMAAGLPLIVSNGTGISKCLLNKQEAFIFPAQDEEKLTDYLLQVLTNEAMALSMAKAGREKALAFFSTSRMVDEIELFLTNGKHQSRS